MNGYTSREAAKKLGISLITLARYISARKIHAPKILRFGGKFRVWTKEDIERVRQLLPKIANGRKTKRSSKESGVRGSKSLGTKPRTRKKPQTNKPVPNKKK